MPDRKYDVSQLTVGELERTRRDLEVSLALITPGSPARAPILAHLSAIDAELAKRAAGEQDLDLVLVAWPCEANRRRSEEMLFCACAREVGGRSSP